ncbi:MAG: hypothetical protein QME96_00315 [Myxococcota bacterium]|nr:hypothetical protein [Myxococcota bacterium]
MKAVEWLSGCAILSVACAFEPGPATHVAVTLEAGPAASIVTDLGYAIELEEARVFIHLIEFLSAGGEEGSGAAHFAHSAGGGGAPAAGRKVGELVVDRFVDLLRDGPQVLGEAVFELGAEGADVLIPIAPPEEPRGPAPPPRACTCGAPPPPRAERRSSCSRSCSPSMRRRTPRGNRSGPTMLRGSPSTSTSRGGSTGSSSPR